MAFVELLSGWIFGKAADKAFDKFKHLLGYNELQADFEIAAKEFGKNLPDSATVNTEVFFGEPIKTSNIKAECPKLYELQQMLVKEKLPSVELWRSGKACWN